MEVQGLTSRIPARYRDRIDPSRLGRLRVDRRRLAHALALFVLFAIWSGVVRAGWSDLISNPLDQLIRAPRTRLLSDISNLLGLLGTPQVSALLALTVAGCIFRRHPLRAGLVLSGFGVALFVEAALKDFLFYPIYGSYPSGHALRAVFLAVVIAQSTSRRGFGFGAVFLALLIGVGRIYVGAHYSDEVIGGIVIGTALAVAVAAWSQESGSASARA